MANIAYTGDAPKQEQIDKLLVSGNIFESTRIQAQIGRKIITSDRLLAGVEDRDNPVQELLQAMASAIATKAETIPELQAFETEVLAATEAEPELRFTALTPGVPFGPITFSALDPAVNVDVIQQGGPGVNEQQSYYITPTPDSGTYRINWNLGSGVETSASIQHDADADGIKASMVGGMASVTNDNVLITGAGSSTDPWVIELQDDLGSTAVSELTIDTSGLTGNGSVTVFTDQDGGPGGGTQVEHFTDAFTDVDGTHLEDHSSDTGCTWWQDPGYGPSATTVDDWHIRDNSINILGTEMVTANDRQRHVIVNTGGGGGGGAAAQGRFKWSVTVRDGHTTNKEEVGLIFKYRGSEKYWVAKFDYIKNGACNISFVKMDNGTESEVQVVSLGTTVLDTAYNFELVVNNEGMGSSMSYDFYCTGAASASTSTLDGDEEYRFNSGVGLWLKWSGRTECDYEIDSMSITSATLAADYWRRTTTGQDIAATDDLHDNTWTTQASSYSPHALLNAQDSYLFADYTQTGNGLHIQTIGDHGPDFRAGMMLGDPDDQVKSGFVYRYLDSDNYWYCVLYVNGSNFILELVKREGGTETSEAIDSVAKDSLYQMNLELSVVDDVHTAEIRSVTGGKSMSVTTTDTFSNTNNKVGVYHDTTAIGANQVSYSFVVEDDAVINDIQHVYTNGEGGTFILTNPDTETDSAALDYNATQSEVKTQLEAIFGGTWTVSGAGTVLSPWVCEAGGALGATNVTEMQGDGTNLTGGHSGNVDTVQEGSAPLEEILHIYVEGATGGTFTFELDQKLTSAIDYNESAAGLDTILEALPQIGTGNLTVSGVGTEADPWVVTGTGALAGVNLSDLYPHADNLTGTIHPNSLTYSNVQISRGPKHWNDIYNWINIDTGAAQLPATGDNVFIETGDVEKSLCFDLDQSAVKLNSLRIRSEFQEGAIVGLPRWNELGYYEYLNPFLKIGLQGDKKVLIGEGIGSGSDLINIDFGSDEFDLRVERSAGPRKGEFRAVNILGSHASNNALVLAGFVNFGGHAGETCNLLKLTVRDGLVLLARGSTVGDGTGVAIDWTGGSVNSEAAVVNGEVISNAA